MKKSIIITGLGFLVLIVTLISCKNEEVPTLTTSEVTNITGTTASSGGTIIDEGSGIIIERGICWSKGITPTIGSNITTESSGIDTYSSNMTNLSAFTTLPAGSRSYYANDDFLGLGHYCKWWSSTEHHTFNNSAWYRSLNTFESVLGRNYYLKRVGYSVRCLMDKDF